MRKELQNQNTQVQEHIPSLEILYASGKMQNIIHICYKLASTSMNALIIGDAGVGKEHIGRLIHSRSKQQNGPFIVVDCLTILEELLEMELFGHETLDNNGNKKVKKGLFEYVEKEQGILFLTRVEKLSEKLQLKLLHLINSGKSYRLGGQEMVSMNARILFSANYNLTQQVYKGEFSQELFSQMRAISIEVPPLKDRKEDIVILMEHFLKRKTNNKNFSLLGKLRNEVLHCIHNYEWPGNVDELKSLCEILPIIYNDKIIDVSDLPKKMQKENSFLLGFTNIEKQILERKIGQPTMTLDNLEKNYILHSLEFFRGNKTRTANVLGITVKTLYNKLNRYNSQTKTLLSNKKAEE